MVIPLNFLADANMTSMQTFFLDKLKVLFSLLFYSLLDTLVFDSHLLILHRKNISAHTDQLMVTFCTIYIAVLVVQGK